MADIGIIGASGYTGAELLRLCAQHPSFNVVYATGDSQAGSRAADVYPSLAAHYPTLQFEAFDAKRLEGLDAVFVGLPHEASLALVPQLVGEVPCVVDLSAAFRLKDASLYPRWYGFEHDQPALLASAVFGLPELHRDEFRGASLIATPGCHVTAATLALAPLVRAGLIETTGVVVDSITGISGAGRALKNASMFCAADSDVTAYGLLDHRHTPEIEQEVGAQVLFTPHLAPLSRGLLATCYARPAGALSTPKLIDALKSFYDDEPFVVVSETSPSTKAVLGSNVAHVSARFDERTGTVIALCAIDNLTKGASGGAVQSANVALGLDETAGLTQVGLYPVTVVIKYGGNALAGATESDAMEQFAFDVVQLHAQGLQPVVVHGGGPQISQLMAERGKQPEFRNGLRVTDAETINIVRAALMEQVNPQLVAAINLHAPVAMGVSGEDVIRASVRDRDLGFVGDVARVDAAVLSDLLASGSVPVIAPLGTDAAGQTYNINADTVAGAVAAALGAQRLVYLTDIEGLRRVVTDATSLIRETTADELDSMLEDGTIADGMIPKVQSCIDSVRAGVESAHIIDGRLPHALQALFSDALIGTVVR